MRRKPKVQSLNEFRNYAGDSLSYVDINAKISNPLKTTTNIISLFNIDVEEEIEGYTLEELDEILEWLDYCREKLALADEQLVDDMQGPESQQRFDWMEHEDWMDN